jgi:hypothetical protein
MAFISGRWRGAFRGDMVRPEKVRGYRSGALAQRPGGGHNPAMNVRES